MKVIVVGMGRMGTSLARSLAKKGHHVTAIDSNPEAFEALGSFKGSKVTGIGFDRDVLHAANIEGVDAVVACTSSDEANIVIARIAKNIYRVPRVIARLYDYSKADTYRRIGIQTISTTTWGTERAVELLTYHHLDSVFDIGNGNVSLVRVDVPAMLAGHRVGEFSSLGEIQVVSVSRANKTFIPASGTLLEEDDILYVAVLSTASQKLKSMLGLA